VKKERPRRFDGRRPLAETIKQVNCGESNEKRGRDDAAERSSPNRATWAHCTQRRKRGKERFAVLTKFFEKFFLFSRFGAVLCVRRKYNGKKRTLAINII
jgi:hypothetical protein